MRAEKTVTIWALAAAGYETSLFPTEPVGKGDINELANTDAFIQALNLPNFRALLFPNFKYLIPDALLVISDLDRYKLLFLEIENKKPNWDEHLIGKKSKYERLGSDIAIYKYWLLCTSILKIRKPKVELFKFSILCISASLCFDDWPGWTFSERLA